MTFVSIKLFNGLQGQGLQSSEDNACCLSLVCKIMSVMHFCLCWSFKIKYQYLHQIHNDWASLRKAKYYTCSLKKQIEDWIFLEREQRQLYENGVDFPSIQNIFLKDKQTSIFLPPSLQSKLDYNVLQHLWQFLYPQIEFQKFLTPISKCRLSSSSFLLLELCKVWQAFFGQFYVIKLKKLQNVIRLNKCCEQN